MAKTIGRARTRVWNGVGAIVLAATLVAPASVAHALPAAEGSSAGSLHTAVRAAVSTVGYFSVPWASTIWIVTSDGKGRELTYDEWRAAGAPKPKVAPITYDKTSWSTTVWGQVRWPAGDKGVDLAVPLTAAMFAKAGKQKINTVAHIHGTSYLTWRSNATEIFARTSDGARHKLTYAQWSAAGSPKPTPSEAGYFRAAWSGDIHGVGVDGKAQRMTFAQWVGAGAPTPGIARTAYVKTPWASTVFGLVSWSKPERFDVVVPLTWTNYVRAGKPTIEQRSRIPGDSFVKFTVGDSVFHVVGGVLTPLTGPQWKSIGSPAPTVKKAPSPTYIRGILLVNKSFPLPPSYGNGLTAETTNAFNAMRGAASSSGLSLRIVSGFRSYASQQSVYAGYVNSLGKAAADRISARPGHSEHQSGLTIDINSVNESFANTAEGRWVAANAHQFGFIVRYPAGKEHITGYSFEPWHLRYVGVEAATHLKRSGLTLDEYLGVPSRY